MYMTRKHAIERYSIETHIHMRNAVPPILIVELAPKKRMREGVLKDMQRLQEKRRALKGKEENAP
jgi:hypothetical protein